MTIYIFDADALINLYIHFPTVFRRLKRFVSVDQAKIPEGVYRELRRKSNKLFKTVEVWERKYKWVVPINTNRSLMAELMRIELAYGKTIRIGDRQYAGFWLSAAGRKAADGQVVAIGKHLNGVTVSDDRSVRYACLLENVECINWSEFTRRSGIFSHQLMLIQP